jgi:hypothetical protein
MSFDRIFYAKIWWPMEFKFGPPFFMTMGHLAHQGDFKSQALFIEMLI